MAKKKEETSVAQAPTTAVGEVIDQPWGCEDIDPTDVLIPKLLLMQGQSDFVAEGKAHVGDIVKSLTGEVVAPRGESVTFIPLNTFKSWRVMEKEGERYEWRRNEEWTDANCHRELQWQELGNDWRADRTLNFYVLLVKDIVREREAMQSMAKGGDLPDGDIVLVPCLIQFLRTSYNAGMKLITEFAKAKKFRKPPASWMFKLGSTQQKNDQNIFQVFTIEQGGVTSKEDLQVAYEWYRTIATQKVKIHESAVVENEVSVEEPPVPECAPCGEEGAQF